MRGQARAPIYACCVSQRRARVRTGCKHHRADGASDTFIIVHWSVAWRRVGVRAAGHAVLHVGRIWLRDDVEHPRDVLMLVCSCAVPTEL